MQHRRRLTFQLTPLLDLLLIVIFAQYMEVQQAAESGDALLKSQQQDLEHRFAQRKRELEVAHAATMKALEESRVTYSEKFQSILDQQHQAGATLAKTFNLPGRAMEEVLRLRTAGKSTDADRLEQAVSQLKKLLESRNDELLRFMIRYDEMQKHVSVWELHLLDNGQAMFSNGKLSQRLSFASSSEFTSTCFEASKAFEEPRPLTLILMTYGDTQAGVRRNVVDGLPDLVQRLRTDTGGTRWFDYSLMGFRPDGPLINPDRIHP
jgi:hypothetical protein